jgi:hypothetical protein
MQNVLKTDGADIALSANELISFINKYIDNPNIKNLEREKIIEEQCYKLDGKSSYRVANYILAALN